MRVRRHKYHAKSSKCLQGHYHPSKIEAGYCDLLAANKRGGTIKDYESQVRFDFVVNGQKICSHIVDFVVEMPDGEKQVHECKGYEHPLWNIKRKLFEALYPDIEYIVIK